jgi:hypothetical protein
VTNNTSAILSVPRECACHDVLSSAHAMVVVHDISFLWMKLCTERSLLTCLYRAFWSILLSTCCEL